tara:strand:- start:2553 stop:2924 length:372 start_codon:yes stop_codon:yes gene_type:complete
MGKVVAVVGASTDREKFGNKALRAYIAEGYKVIPINPKQIEVEGLKSYSSVLNVPCQIDIATVYVQPHVALNLLSDFSEKGIAEIWINPGAESKELLAVAKSKDLNVILACSIIGVGRSPDDF